MFKLDSKDSITKAIASIGRAGVRLIAAIQTAAVQVIGHAVQHGDVTLANALLDATPKHQRAALVAFLEMYGPFAYMKQDKNLAFYRENVKLTAGTTAGKLGDGSISITQEYVDALPRWESLVKPAEPRSVYDVQEEADRFITRMRKLASVSTNSMKHRKLLDDLTAAYNKYVAAQALGDAAENATGENVTFQPLTAVSK